MVIYNYNDRIWIILVTLKFCITYTNQEKYYPGEQVNMHIQILINIIQKKNRPIYTKKDKGKLPLFVITKNGQLPSMVDPTEQPLIKSDKWPKPLEGIQEYLVGLLDTTKFPL